MLAVAPHHPATTVQPRQVRRVHFVEFNAKVNTLAISPLFPKYGTPLLAAVLREHGYDVTVFLEGISHLDPQRLLDCDALCLPVYAPALNKVRAFAQQARALRPDLPIILGGPQVNLFPETVLDVCDYAVRCEGDEVLPELLACLRNGGDPLQIDGLSLLVDGQPHHTADRTPPPVPDTAPDLTLIDGYHEAVRRLGWRKVVNSLQTSRGCHFHCKFCPTSKLFAGSFRSRAIEATLADIRGRVRTNPFFFVVDNSFLGDRAHATELLHRLAKEDTGARFIVFERHQVGHDAEMLELMKRAGVVCIIVGIESLADDALKLYDKRQSSSIVQQHVEAILAHDVHVIGTFILGGDSDTPASADGIVRFVRDTGVSLNLFVMHDLEIDESKGLIMPLNRRFETYYARTAPRDFAPWDYLTGSFATYFPQRMKPSTLQECMLDVYERVFSHTSIARRMMARNRFAATFGVEHGYGVKRLTESIRGVCNRGYMAHLRRIEDGLYDANEVLQEDRLAALAPLPLPPAIEDHVDTQKYERLAGVLQLPGVMRIAPTFLRYALRRS